MITKKNRLIVNIDSLHLLKETYNKNNEIYSSK